LAPFVFSSIPEQRKDGSASVMTAHQEDLLAKLRAIWKRHDPALRRSHIEVSGGPRVFDVKCSEAGRTVWHWVGTADQIADALNKWIDRKAIILTGSR
jgi:hypothetical protein